MAMHLPVSSFPDVFPHERPLGLDVRIIVTPPPSKKRRPYLPYVFGKNSSRPTTPDTVPEPETESTDSVAEVSNRGVYPGLREASPLRSISPRHDEVHHHGAHHRSASGGLLRHRLSRASVLPDDRAPRSTKESIAILGLSRRTPSPDSSTSSDTDSMVACCYSSGWIDPQALPPLPPVPPTSPSPCSEPPSRSASSLGRDVKESFQIIPDNDDDCDKNPREKDLEVSLEQSSVPPSPITFSHRNSAFIAMESSQGLKGSHDETLTTISLDAESSLRWRPSSRSPTPTAQKRADILALSPEFAADVAARPWTRVSHISTAALFAPAPKLLKPGQIYIPSSPSTTSPHKLGVKLHSWKIFRRRHSMSADDNDPCSQQPSNEKDAEPSTRPSTRCAWTRRRHRNSVHVVSISESMHSEPLSPDRSSVGSDITLSNAQDELVREVSRQRSMNTLRSVTTHRVAGDRWREEDIETVIDTLRTMKVGKLR